MLHWENLDHEYLNDLSCLTKDYITSLPQMLLLRPCLVHKTDLLDWITVVNFLFRNVLDSNSG